MVISNLSKKLKTFAQLYSTTETPLLTRKIIMYNVITVIYGMYVKQNIYKINYCMFFPVFL